ncbi:hypothetical protein [Bradyrhizobium sp. CCGUVB23]|uniref:hypothetical protein n=1 Tax=Bradyrhizobium sp. CCGUVB23 TaxID=2949630 RepID=UPI0020B30152|nr:hypothetical protein [Bradyrhizobium sp. CCGUVB23]MCP3460963.1 hypothetical protein [Bradyrhizobium sp. CCGUVB23]
MKPSPYELLSSTDIKTEAFGHDGGFHFKKIERPSEYISFACFKKARDAGGQETEESKTPKPNEVRSGIRSDHISRAMRVPFADRLSDGQLCLVNVRHAIHYNAGIALMFGRTVKAIGFIAGLA